MNGMVSQFYLIANSLAGTEQNHQVISQNIANVNTPGYRARAVDFETMMSQIKNGTADREIVEQMPVELMEGLLERQDGNNVDLDGQLGALKKNSLLFQTYSHLLASKMAMARRAMSS